MASTSTPPVGGTDDDELRDVLAEVAGFHAEVERNLSEALTDHPTAFLLAAADYHALFDQAAPDG